MDHFPLAQAPQLCPLLKAAENCCRRRAELVRIQGCGHSREGAVESNGQGLLPHTKIPHNQHWAGLHWAAAQSCSQQAKARAGWISSLSLQKGSFWSQNIPSFAFPLNILFPAQLRPSQWREKQWQLFAGCLLPTFISVPWSSWSLHVTFAFPRFFLLKGFWMWQWDFL